MFIAMELQNYGFRSDKQKPSIAINLLDSLSGSG